MIASPIDSASAWLNGSNVLYVAGAVLTLAAAALVLVEKRAVLAGKRAKETFRAEASVVLAALVSVLGTIGAIHFSNVVSHLKDLALQQYQQEAGIRIAQAKLAAATADQKAEEARNKADQNEKENLVLRRVVSLDETTARTAEAELAKANKETSDFAHSLQQQQATMQEQAKVSPQLTQYQIQTLASVLKPFAGQDVALHQTSDTVVARLGATIKMALDQAGLTTKYYSTDMGELYQGVSVAVHDPNNVPPVANALVLGLHQAGINVHPVAAPQRVPAGTVGIFLGPN
jgi:hypothetical protein